MFRRRSIFVAVLLAVVSVGFGSWSYERTQKSYDYTASYVGRQSCTSCHAEQVQRWTGSHHDLAMDPATPETIVDVEAFADREFQYFDVTSKFFRRGDKFYVTTDDADGTLQTFEIKYVFGVDPLQQYMVEFPDKKTVRNPQGEAIELPAGRIQVLSTAWDTHNGRWFHLYPKEKIPAGDWLHWTGGGQNWNYMCAECHSTNLQKNYDPPTNAYHTTWSEIDVSCEACHGPASEHLVRAEASLGFNDPRHFHSYALNKLKGPSSSAEIETCAPCHSRRRIVHGDYSPGRKYYDFYEVEKLDGALYHADGQIKEELYEYGSFMQSRMFREGVRCSNCHDPHSLQPKFAGNALCTQCHIPAKYDAPSHHHHQPGSTGAKCVECHMPETTYMEVDPRRDHSIRIPRPDLTKKLGTPNACSQCHDATASRPSPPAPLPGVPGRGEPNRVQQELPEASGRGEPNLAQQELRPPVPWFSTDQLITAVEAWYPNSPTRKRPHFGEILQAGRVVEPAAGAALRDLAQPRPQDTAEQRAVAVGPIVRASAVALLAAYPSAATRDSLRRALNDSEPLVRSAAIRAITSGLDEIPVFKNELVTKLDDPIRAVRTEAANALTQFPRRDFTPAERTRFEQVFREWEEGQRATIDAGATNVSLANAYVRMMNSSDLSTKTAELEAIAFWGGKADRAFKRALAIDPLDVRAIMSYSKFLDIVNRDAEAELWLRKALDAVPYLPSTLEGRSQFVAEVHYELGWLLFRDPSGSRLGDAAAEFKTALDNEPNNPQALQYYGLAMLGLNRFSEAEALLTQYGRLDPQGAAALVTYAQRAARSGQNDQARTLLRAALAIDVDARKHHPPVEPLLRELGIE